ncbi:MAG: 6-phosphofructokinase [archaeon]
MRRVVVAVCGGGGNGANDVMYAMVRSLGRGYEIIGVKKAFEGLLSPNLEAGGIAVRLTPEDLRQRIFDEGSILGLSREPPYLRGKAEGDEQSESQTLDSMLLERFQHKKAQLMGANNGVSVRRLNNKERIERIRHNLLDVLKANLFTVIGGDGTYRSLGEFFSDPDGAWLERMTIGCPNIMDNDIASMTMFGQTAANLSPGYSSAATKLLRFHENLVSVARNHQRVILHETFGRHWGWATAILDLANASSLALPEKPFTFDTLDELARRIVHNYRTFGYDTVGIAEGLRFGRDVVDVVKNILPGYKYFMETDGYCRVGPALGPNSRKLGGAGYVVEKLLNMMLGDEIPIRVVASNYTPREKDPTTGLAINPYDFKFCYAAGECVAGMVREEMVGFMPRLASVVDYRGIRPAAFEQFMIRDTHQSGIPDGFLPAGPVSLEVKPVFTDYVRMITEGPRRPETKILGS